jgi:hypothetical protein
MGIFSLSYLVFTRKSGRKTNGFPIRKLFMADKTGITLAFYLMTGFTSFHRHDLRGITGDPFIIISWILFRFAADGGVTGTAFHFGHLGVGGMGEKNMVRLFRIDKPWNIFVFLFQLLGQFYKFGFLFGIPLWGGMAIKAFAQTGNPGETSIRSESMAFGTLQTGTLAMLQVTKVNRLILPRMD